MAAEATYEVEISPGKFIRVNGPEDASEEELIAKARTHPSLNPQTTKSATTPSAQTTSTGVKPGELPALSSPDQLLKEAKQGTPSLQASVPGAYEATKNTDQLPTAGGLYDLASKGDFQGAWNALPENVRNVTQYGAPVAAAILAGKAGYDLYKSGKEPTETGTGIKARTISGTPTAPTQTAPTQTAPSAPTAPAEPALSSKEAKIASDIENKYGFSWKDIKSNFGVSDVPITNHTEAEMLAGAYQQKQAKPAAPVETIPVAPEVTPTAKPVAETAPVPASVAKPVEPPASVKATLGEPTVTTGSGMPAYQGQGAEGSKLAHKQGSFESLAKVPKDYVFVPGGQNMDILRNAVGQTEYTKNLKTSGGYPASQAEAYKQSVEINRSLGRVSNAEAKAAKTYVEPTKSITKRIADSKAVRVGGVTGALILASDLANAAQEGAKAAQEGDRQLATGYLTDIIGALTGPVGYTASQVFGTSPEELKTLRSAEQARKVGAGRGVAPPSAYLR